MVYIGIDPDIYKSGVATYLRNTKELFLESKSFFELFDYLKETKEMSGKNLKVILEAGWLNKKSNWHNEKSGVRVASKIGKNIGANHETGKKIEEMLQYLEIEYKLVVPNKSKVNNKQFRQITGYIGRVNQDMRDAAMLIYGL